MVRPAIGRLVAKQPPGVVDREQGLAAIDARRNGTVGKTSAMRSALGRIMTVSAAATIAISAPSMSASSASLAACATSRAST